MRMCLLLLMCLLVVVMEARRGGGSYRSSSSRIRTSSSTSRSRSGSGSSWFRRSSSSSSRSSRSSSSASRSSYPRQSWGSSSSSSSSSSSRSSSSRRGLSSIFGGSRKPSSSSSSRSSYPTQQYGSSSGSRGSTSIFGSGSSRTSSTGTSSGFGGGFSKPSSVSGFNKPATSSTSGFTKPAAAAGIGAAGGFLASKPSSSSSSIGGGGFVKPSTGTGSLGGGGFVKPSSTSTGAGGFLSKFGGTKTPSSGFSSSSSGGGFGKTLAAGGLGAAGGLAAGTISRSKGSSSTSGGIKSAISNVFKPKKTGTSSGSSGSSGLGKNLATHGLAGLGGAAGGYALGKSKYKNKYSYPKTSLMSKIFKKKPKAMKSSGYGTKWGTSFGTDTKYQKKKGFSKKVLGLGVAAGFVGGAALGIGGTMATYSVYHRYRKFKDMMRYRGFRGRSHGFQYDDDDDFYDNNYYSSYYSSNECMGGCPLNSHCEWGFCECDYGFERRFGRCGRVGAVFVPRPARFDPFTQCTSTAGCQSIDINMVCNTRLTVQTGGKCQCKQDMKWNEASGECQFFFDVDCSRFTYDTKPSRGIIDAVSRAEANGLQNFIPDESSGYATPTIEESIGSSLLSQIDRDRASADEMREAYCRDIDAFSFDMNVDDGRPPTCEPVPRTACGVVYDEPNCNSWKLIITQGEVSFGFWSSYHKYRNDIELIGVKAGCTLTAFSNTGFTNQRGTFRAGVNDFWWKLRDYAEYQHLDEDIESIQCVCTSV